MRRAIKAKQLECVFYVIFSDLKALFPLVYFMQNHEGSKITVVRYNCIAKGN